MASSPVHDSEYSPEPSSAPAALFDPLRLPNGGVIANRLAKAAMEENMADSDHAPSEPLIRLYQAWADGGAGLVITGNVGVDARALTGPACVVLEHDRHLARFQRWAQVAKSGGAQVWMQINHAGRQVPASLGQPAVAPSAVAIDLGKMSKYFVTPRAMTSADIDEVIQRFATTARLAQASGFDGVQVHAAHGYLISQFLSPLTNRRDDDWGGSLPRRARLLLDVVRAIRNVVRPDFAVAVKLNSADFQRGGFSADDAQQVVQMLNSEGVDLVELSGGSYEAPAMQGQARDGRTLAREAYFLEFAQQIGRVAQMPLMVTGGIRRRAVADQVLASGVAMAGIATALAIDPALPKAWQRGENRVPELPPVTWSNKSLGAMAVMAVVKYQLGRLSEGRVVSPGVSPVWALLGNQWKTAQQARRYRRWMAKDGAR